MAITNCLNFGNPKRPEVYFQLREAVGGMGEACEAFGTPVTGGNVSLYNESPSGAVYPDAGHRDGGPRRSDIDHVTRATFQQAGDTILLLGEHDRRAWRQRVPRAHSRRRRGCAAAVRPPGRASASSTRCSRRSRPAWFRRRTTAATAGSPSRSPSAAWQTANSRCGATVDLSSWSAIAEARTALRRGAGSRRGVDANRRLTSRKSPPRTASRYVESVSSRRPTGPSGSSSTDGAAHCADRSSFRTRTTTRFRRIMSRVAVADDALAADARFDRGQLTHVWHLRSSGCPGRGVDRRTSACTRCSTADRSPPASSPIDDDGTARAVRNMGLVSDGFDGADCRVARRIACDRPHALQHGGLVDDRERAAGARALRGGHIALAHNGNLTNADRAATRARGRRVDLHVDDGLRGARPPPRQVFG